MTQRVFPGSRARAGDCRCTAALRIVRSSAFHGVQKRVLVDEWALTADGVYKRVLGTF